jgi:hypothetical protein
MIVGREEEVSSDTTMVAAVALVALVALEVSNVSNVGTSLTASTNTLNVAVGLEVLLAISMAYAVNRSFLEAV